jgi:hypothetical protein
VVVVKKEEEEADETVNIDDGEDVVAVLPTTTTTTSTPPPPPTTTTTTIASSLAVVAAGIVVPQEIPSSPVAEIESQRKTSQKGIATNTSPLLAITEASSEDAEPEEELEEKWDPPKEERILDLQTVADDERILNPEFFS